MKKSIVKTKTSLNFDELRELFSEETLSSFELQALKGGEDGSNTGCTNTDCNKVVICIKLFCGTTCTVSKDSTCTQPIKDTSCTVAKDSICG